MRGIFCMHWTYEEKCPFLNYSLGLVRVLIFDTGSQHIYTLRFRKEAILDHLQLSDVTVSIYIPIRALDWGVNRKLEVRDRGRMTSSFDYHVIIVDSVSNNDH